MAELKTDITEVVRHANTLLTDGKNVLESMNELREWNSFEEIVANMGNLNRFFLKVVSAVEFVSSDAYEDLEGVVEGNDKLDAVVEILDELIKLPFYLEMFDGMAIRMAISMTVQTINRVLGNKWDTSKLEAFVKHDEEMF